MSDLSEKLGGILNGLKKSIGEQIFSLVMAQLLTTENILAALNFVLDKAEEFASKTETKLDDAAIAKIREALNLPK